MVKQIKIIIGANLGDEGKGQTTDFICKKAVNPLVIRFNSGSQAGHTVVTKEGKRHVFGHFGSGSFQNIPTFLSHFFVVNPMTFQKERKELNKKEVFPILYADKNCFLTTPYDMLLNQLIEITREENRHGSCGLGFYETLVRNLKKEYAIQLKDLGKKDLEKKLYSIKEDYIPKKIKEYNITNIPEKFQSLFSSKTLLLNYLEELSYFSKFIKITTLKQCSASFDSFIFEGAQGLMLDMDYPTFPYVTPSKTGLYNVIHLLEEEKIGYNEIEVIYVTRCYLTRHGAGPLPGELSKKPYPNIEDFTNVSNDYQGSLRFAYLNLDILKENIKKDLKEAEKLKLPIKKRLCITCLDQAENKIKYVLHNEQKEETKEKFLKTINEYINIPCFTNSQIEM